ncbi:MAG: hypothetical protein K2K63_11505 [Acetatifactor sp.]|nr:hypothetical protein [Acetatifactor sp.]
MKRTVLAMVALIIALTGCTSAETDKEKTVTSTESAVSIDSSQAPTALPLDYEALTVPPILTVSTLNAADSVIASCGNSHWNCAMPDGTTTTILACGAHPLDQQEHPILCTAFPVLYLDFGEILPETVSAVRWPASYIGDAQGHSADFEEVEVEFEENMITLIPLGDGDYIYEISAAWGEVGEAGYTFRTLPQMQGEQTDISTGIFDALNGLEYQPYTCDGLPEYRLTAADGTVYAINISEKWVWRGNNEQAELSDELITQLKEYGN